MSMLFKPGISELTVIRMKTWRHGLYIEKDEGERGMERKLTHLISNEGDLFTVSSHLGNWVLLLTFVYSNNNAMVNFVRL